MDINTCKFVYEKRGNILGRGEGRRILETKRVSSSSFSFVLSLITTSLPAIVAKDQPRFV